MNRRQFLVGSGAVLGASAVRPTVARAQAPRGHIIAGLSERMLTLDPANHYSISATSVLRHIFDPLLDVTNDASSCPRWPSRWRAVNNTTWRFTLRKGVTFHDGTPFNADSVVFTLKRVRDNTKLIKSFVYQDIEDVEKDGDYAVTVTTEAAVRLAARAPHHARACCRPARRGERGGVLPEADRHRARSGSCAWTHGDHIALAANPSYWKPGVPKVEKVTVPLHPGAVHPRGRPARGRDPRDRPRDPGHGPDAQGHAAA